MMRSVVILSWVLGAWAQTETNTLSIGYMKTGSSYSYITCPATTATFVASGSYWGCSPYPAAGLGLVTGCTSGTLLLPGGNTQYSCIAGDQCNTGYLFSDLNDQSPLSEYGCLPGAGTTTYYRSLPASVLAAVTGSSSSVSPTQSSSPTGSSSPVSPSSGSSTPSSSAAGASHSASKAWIAGAVIGPVLGLALVGLGVWVWALRRQRQQRDLTQPKPVLASASLPNPPGPAELEEHKGSWVFVPESTPQAPPTEAHASPQSSELHAQHVSELPGQQGPVELAGPRKI